MHTTSCILWQVHSPIASLIEHGLGLWNHVHKASMQHVFALTCVCSAAARIELNWFALYCTHSLTHSPTHPLTHSPTHPLTHSLIYPPTHPPTHPPTSTHSLTYSLTQQFSNSGPMQFAMLSCCINLHYAH